MAKKTTEQMKDLFKASFKEVKGNRTSGWEAEDSEKVALALISALGDKNGEDITLSPDRLEKIQAALAITPKRVTKRIKAELEADAVEVDEFIEEKILWLADLPKVRADLTTAGLLQKPGKGKQAKEKVVDLLK